MITKVSVRGFQSLRLVDLDLGDFTVIVGPSSSGKSALIRAFRALASNVRGSQMITRGQKAMAISVTTDQGLIVTLERDDRSSAYRLGGGEGPEQFTKLAGEVPAAVTAALRLDPGSDSVNFAGQFDRPYLLDESGATIARQLAELTNVRLIFEAVRQANRTRASALSTLRTRQQDLESAREGLKAFSGLSEQLKVFGVVEGLNEARKELLGRVERLETAIRALRVTQRAMERFRPAERLDHRLMDEAYQRLARIGRLNTRVAVVRNTRVERVQAQQAVHRLAQEHEELAQELAELLERAGVCPTCGRPVDHPASRPSDGPSPDPSGVPA